jgi:RimJ/RimL family protein N-acetyltransferase
MGYATEACSAIVRAAFDDLEIDRLFALILPANVASARVAARLGFQAERKIEYKHFGLVDLLAKYRAQ